MRQTPDADFDRLLAHIKGSGEMVRADEIRWHSEPLPRLEDVDVVDIYAMSHDALLGYTYGLQSDLRAVRTTLSVALTQLHDHTVQAAKQSRRIRQLLVELQRLRHGAA